MRELLDIRPHVAEALAAKRPVVALESTIISHGMPYPRNLSVAQRVEATIWDGGAVPATIGVLDGRICIGLGQSELERFATESGIAKASRRDLPVLLATHRPGATTVAATMIGAELAGIAIMATGGIGGVHRGGEMSLDVSADLEELARARVAVVCAGAKSILDLARTLEYLETRGVPVIGYGTDELPAFHSRTSGLELEHSAQTAAEVARIMRAKWRLGLAGGIVVANPIPPEAAIDPGIIERAIAAAEREADSAGIRGKALTPYLLSRLESLTGGATLEANVALILDNARVAAEIATAYASEVAADERR